MSVVLANAGFESGGIYPWIASAPNVAVVTETNANYAAYEGQFCLHIFSPLLNSIIQRH
ncbi:hypothetical protein BDV12DRAFT_172582 [Aspergillus spectabilis]